MVLEATVICLDNSEWMRNGDYPPTRFQAQTDAVNLICGAKTQANPENTVGVLSMGGSGVRVLVTPTADLGKILSSMHGLDIGGQSNLLSAVQVAQLALKHRQNKNQRQRIVLFTGSPVGADVDTLVKIGKKLKKNNVALDIVSFGDIDEDPEKADKLEALLGAVNSNDNSHLVTVPPGPAMLSDVLISSPIFTGDGEGGSGFAAAAAAGAAAAAAAGGLGGDFDFGVDPNLDPELALALRVSMEEERARQEAAARKAREDEAAKAGDTAGPSDQEMKEAAPAGEAGGAAGSTAAGVGSVAAAAAGGSIVSTAGDDVDAMEDEAALLQEALAMSLAEAGAAGAAPMQGTEAEGAASSVVRGAAGEDDAELALALQMSMEASAAAQLQASAQPQQSEAGSTMGTAGAGGVAGDAEMSNVLGDAALINSILASLPGVDPNDPSVQDVLASLSANQKKDGDGDQEQSQQGESK